MKTLNLVLIILLTLSVAINVFLYQSLAPSLSATGQPHDQAMNSTPSVTGVEISSDAYNVDDAKPMRLTSPELSTKPDAETRLSWIDQTKRWLAAGEMSRARDFIQRYLQQHPRDIEFLLLEAELVDNTAHISEVLAHYYSVLDLPLSDEQRIAVNKRIQILVNDNTEKLKQIQSWDILATFLEPLWQFAPTNRDYILMLSEAYARQQMVSLMEYVLASVLPDDPDAVRIRRLIRVDNTSTKESNTEQIDTSQYEKAIALARLGDHFIVKAELNSNKVNLMIDTGASTTVLTRKAFNKLKGVSGSKELIGEYLVNTAGGQIKAPVYRLSQLAIDDYQVSNVAIVVLPMEEFNQADGLLGMNYLRKFVFRIDQQQALLFLK